MSLPRTKLKARMRRKSGRMKRKTRLPKELSLTLTMCLMQAEKLARKTKRAVKKILSKP